MSRPQPAYPFFTLASGATSVAILNVGSRISFGEGALSRGSGARQCGLLGSWLVLTPLPLTYNPG